MSVYRPKGKSPYYHYDFQYRGHRFHGSTGCTNRREAEAFERDALKQAQRASKATEASTAVISLQLDQAAERYWQEVGQYHVCADNTERDLARLVNYFGKTKLLSEIQDDDVARLVAWRRTSRKAPHNLPKGRKLEDYPFIGPATVNRSTTEVLKKLFTHAKTAWRVKFDHEPIWRVHMLKEPEERVRELVGDEGARLEAATRNDYAAFFAFVRATGLRRKECVDLRWSEVNFETGQIVRLGKGGKRIAAPITPYLREVLESCRGHHPEFVFTYVATRTVKARRAGETTTRTGNRKTKGQGYTVQRDQAERIKGQRYPLTLAGVVSAWKRIREDAGVEGFRFHDFRHDLASKVLRRTGNLKLVSKMLNHADLKTTMRYAHVLDEEVAEALGAYHDALRPGSAPMQNGEMELRNKKSRN